MIEFLELNQRWKRKEFLFQYTTNHHYRVDIQTREEGFRILLMREKLAKPIVKSFSSDLFSQWLENPWVLACLEDGEIIAFVETSDESWNNRMRIANLWVEERHRYQGLGKQLMAKAIERAQKANQRAVVLETQSCNDPAIRFYRSCGFELIGLDSTHYQNDDVDRGEVRLEFGLKL